MWRSKISILSINVMQRRSCLAALQGYTSGATSGNAEGTYLSAQGKQEVEAMLGSNKLAEFSKGSFTICLFYCSKPRLKLDCKHTP